MNQKAFTLIELLVAIAIVGILAGFVFVQLNNANGAALDAKKKTGVDAIRKAILFYDVEEGRYPIENNPCTVGVDCENLDDLESLPKILSNLTYTYQSDGTDCTISITLSTGYAYQYDCLNNSYQTNAPIVGSCGSANGFSFYTAPTENLCSSGTASPISGSGPWSWNCTGAYTGGDASCTASLKVDGACGNRAATYPYTQSDWTTSTSYCSTGTESDSPSFPNLGYSVSWSCSGSNGGIDANNCTATRQDYPSPCISGGGLTCVETADGLYFVDTYTYSASPGEYTWTAPSGVTDVEVLIVGGGGAGAGGRTFVGAGGAGGVLYGSLTGLSGTYSVKVGAGGVNNGCCSGVCTICCSSNGGNSSFGSYIAYGGGAGSGGAGRPNNNGKAGGSGGGGAQGDDETGFGGGATQTSQSPLTGYGNSGGFGGICSGGGGGGGASGAGSNCYGGGSGSGGAGKAFDITVKGSSVTYATGGGSGSGAGQNNLGNGGGTASAGGSGVLIIRYHRPW